MGGPCLHRPVTHAVERLFTDFIRTRVCGTMIYGDLWWRYWWALKELSEHFGSSSGDVQTFQRCQKMFSQYREGRLSPGNSCLQEDVLNIKNLGEFALTVRKISEWSFCSMFIWMWQSWMWLFLDGAFPVCSRDFLNAVFIYTSDMTMVFVDFGT